METDDTFDIFAKNFNANRFGAWDSIGGYVISTVRMPPQLSYSHETLVFDRSEDPDSWLDIDSARYDDEDEALEGHKEMVEKYKNIVTERSSGRT